MMATQKFIYRNKTYSILQKDWQPFGTPCFDISSESCDRNRHLPSIRMTSYTLRLIVLPRRQESRNVLSPKFAGFRHVRKTAKSDYQLRHVCQSVRMEQLGSHWTDFLMKFKIGLFFRKYVMKIKVSLQFAWNNGYII